jgi:hypothetical protein
MRIASAGIALAALLLPAMALAQSVEPPPGIGVDRVTLNPGETKAFTLAPGKSHQLLVPTDPDHPASGAIIVHYETNDGGSHITVRSLTGYPLGFSVLADRDGDGGFEPVADLANVAGDGSPVRRDWRGNLGTINVGDFVGAPPGDKPHDAPSG